MTKERHALVKVIYHCYGGAHSSPVAAGIHVGLISGEQPPQPEQLMALPCFEKTTKSDRGNLFHIGTDELGNDVFVLGRGSEPGGIQRALLSGLRLNDGEPPDGDILFVDTLHCVNLTMRVGGFLSRALKWTSMGRPIVIAGTRRAHGKLARVVERTKAKLRSAQTGDR